jgi:sortase A
MAIYSYRKKVPSPTRKVIKILSIISIFTGCFILFWVLYPIVSFELYYAPKFGTLLRPIPNDVIKEAFSTELFQMLGTAADFTKASAWFPSAATTPQMASLTTYTLSIPKLNIDNVTVTVGNDDLSRSLVHFTGPLPGNVGNPVIFGHSTIVWLYNPEDYKTIFTKLPELVRGDDILVTVDKITYKYQVTDMHVTSAEDLSVLTQEYDNAYITLITCVPPGTYMKRLIVKGKLVTI